MHSASCVTEGPLRIVLPMEVTPHSLGRSMAPGNVPESHLNRLNQVRASDHCSATCPPGFHTSVGGLAGKSSG